MDAKKINLFFIILCTSTMLLPLTYKEARLIRKDLYAKHENNSLNVSQLIENNRQLSDIIEQDLQILYEHKNKLQQKIDFQKYLRHYIPIWNKLIAFIYGGASAITGAFTFGASLAVDNLWNAKNDTRLRWFDRGVRFGSWSGFMTPEAVAEYNQNKLENLEERYPGFTTAIKLMPITAGISVIAGLLFFKKIYTIIKYHSTINKNIKKIQERWSHDQAIIAKLKEIKYELKKSL